MKAAVVWEAGNSPVYSEFEEPTPREGEVRVHVTASAERRSELLQHQKNLAIVVSGVVRRLDINRTY